MLFNIKRAHDYMMERTEMIKKGPGGVSEGAKSTSFKIANIVAVAILVILSQ